ncbi:MAG TPA: choice-of-anchor D domain-containing protein, partial [Gammaproteobacteria bacterium]|nr:choice-of-anchor D domain-containing protein [Gammaproteobacteria bacterium]
MQHSKSTFIHSLLLLSFLCLHGIASATEIVRFNVKYYDSAQDTVIDHILDIELFDNTTPLTTANFLNYVNAGKYDGLLVNRSQIGFIIQAGRYTFRPVTPTSFLRPINEGTGLELVPLESSSPIKSEFNLTSITNVRGTLAMALLSHDPNSATNEWFINLNDNSPNLDNQNGGFTVFGRVIDNGMNLADEISLFPILSVAVDVLGPDFADLPVGNPPPFGTGILEENLIIVNSATASIQRPVLIINPDATPLPLDVSGDATGSLQFFTLTNTGNQALTVTPIVDNLSAELTLETDNCSGVTLDPISINPVSSCDISIRFIAATTSIITDALDISYFFNTDNYTKTLNLRAEGVPATAVLDVSRVSLAFLQTDLTATRSKTITIRNKGGAALTINSITSDNTDYTFDNAGCTTATVLALDETCDLVISFSPTTQATITGNIDISTTAGNASVQLGGVGVDPVLLVSSTVDFGTTILSQPILKSLVVANDGAAGLLLTTFEITGTDADTFSFTSNCPDAAINANGFCLINITFTPTSIGTKTATLTINSNDADNPQAIIALTGSVADLNSSDGNIAFANTVVGDPASTRVLTLENLGGGSITINSITVSGTDANLFSFDSAGCAMNSTLGS